MDAALARFRTLPPHRPREELITYEFEAAVVKALDAMTTQKDVVEAQLRDMWINIQIL